MSDCVGAQLSLFVAIASNDSFAVIANECDSCDVPGAHSFYYGGERGITAGILPSAPAGPHFVRSKSLPAILSNLRVRTKSSHSQYS